MTIKKMRPAKYSNNAISESKSIALLELILDKSKVITHLSKNDKTPNYDGFIEVIDNEGYPVGKIETQIKTHRENYTSPSFSVELKLLVYARDVAQLPFFLIAVDQKNNKAFWKEISRDSAIQLIDKALDKSRKQKSISIKFENENEIYHNPPYNIWGAIVEEHKKLIYNSGEINKQLLVTTAELNRLKSEFNERNSNSNYIQMHIFLDTLNNLFYNEFKIIKKLFVSDFWKLGLITFGEVTEKRIAYSLFSIGWNENFKQIDSYQESQNFQEFINNYPSVKSYSNKNPIVEIPVNYAYETLWEYLKLMLDKKFLWPNNESLERELLFYLKDTQFNGNKIEEVKTLELISFKQEIEEYLILIPENKRRLMQVFPELTDNLYRALDYIQNLRIQGKNSIIRQTPSKQTMQSIAISVGETGQFPENIASTLFDYWDVLLRSYENVVEEFFPQIKSELSNYNCTYIIIPFIELSSVNNKTFGIGWLSVLKLNNAMGKQGIKVIIEKNDSNIKLDYKNNTVLYKDKKYKYVNYSIEKIVISRLGDNMPIRKGVYNLLAENLKRYFEKRMVNL